MDLAANDKKAVTFKLSKLDDVNVMPVTLALWKVIGRVVVKEGAMMVKPVQADVVQQVLTILGLFDGMKREEDKKKHHEKMIDMSCKIYTK